MKYLSLIILCFVIASIISLIGTFILMSTALIGTADSDFRNLPYGIAVAFNLYLALGTLPVFFNLIDRVRDNLVWSLASFFLLPILFVLLSLLAMWDQPWPGVLFCVPYFLVLIIFFLRFRKAQA
ncbi:MAG: hypothetical protein EOO07_36295 [Chitinophagaceae bacterium]|nr:MAG: hypothetical protein EOO07_36295 [Chitinophagaceae bacterium]